MRKFAEEQVAPDKLERVLNAVRWAPSWVNLQPWEVVVIDDPAVKEALQQAVPPANPSFKSVVAAPIVIAICGRLGKSGFYGAGKPATVYGDWVMFDIGIAAQNLCLAAWAEGLGTVHLGMLDHVKAGQVLGLPDDVKLYELIPLGVPAKEGKAPPRREIKDFTSWNHYGKKSG
jgi:nitroreductase